MYILLFIFLQKTDIDTDNEMEQPDDRSKCDENRQGSKRQVSIVSNSIEHFRTVLNLILCTFLVFLISFLFSYRGEIQIIHLGIQKRRMISMMIVETMGIMEMMMKLKEELWRIVKER